ACLLAWASAHYAREFGAAAKRVTNFGEDLRDGLVLFSLLAGYWPAYGSKKSSLATAAPVSADSCHDNAELVIRLMKDMGLPFDLVATDISQPDPKEMMVLLLRCPSSCRAPPSSSPAAWGRPRPRTWS
ncbi:calponin-homology (CH) domain-containing protein, partial [Haematococcus lacustris]